MWHCEFLKTPGKNIWPHSHTFVFVPHSQYPEKEGSDGDGKKPSPIAPHSKECECYFNTEEHTWNTQTTQGMSIGTDF